MVEPSEDGWTPATELQEELEVVDRNIVLGDCVTGITDLLGQVTACTLGTVEDVAQGKSTFATQMGVVTGCERWLDVRLSDGSIVRDVPSSSLRKTMPFHEKQYVLHKGWLGRVKQESAIDVATNSSNHPTITHSCFAGHRKAAGQVPRWRCCGVCGGSRVAGHCSSRVSGLCPAGVPRLLLLPWQGSG